MFEVLRHRTFIYDQSLLDIPIILFYNLYLKNCSSVWSRFPTLVDWRSSSVCRESVVSAKPLVDPNDHRILMPVSESKRVAVIGGGCTGITSFWALQNSNHDVHLFEASACLGGRVKSLPFEHNECRVHVNSEPSSFNAQASR